MLEEAQRCSVADIGAQVITSFFWSKKWFLWAYGGGLFILTLLYSQVQLSVRFNDWYGRFYDLVQKPAQHTVADFYASLTEFMWIAIPYIFVVSIVNFLTRHYSFRWRTAITFDYIPRWRNVDKEIEGASQRIQEDTYKFAKIVESLGIQAVTAVMTLIAFLPVLWVLSKGIPMPFVGNVSGSLVWTTLLISIGGMGISWFVGWKLPGLEYNNQKVEAMYRKELVFGEDDKMHFASFVTLTGLFTGLRFNYYRLFLHYGYFDLWLNVYLQCLVVVPFVIAGPSLFSGAITLGTMMQIFNAFGEVHGSFSLPLRNWTTITELRSIWKRLHEFEANLEKYAITQSTTPT